MDRYGARTALITRPDRWNSVRKNSQISLQLEI
jgi:hypothetical protein